MGAIRDDVLQNHLHIYPDEMEIAKVFTNGFDVNWARKRRAHNTELSCYILGAEDFMKQTFGFDFEIALFLSKYDKSEPRTIQAINQILSEPPYIGRVDNGLFIVVGRDSSIEDWIGHYSTVNPMPRTAIGMNESSIISDSAADPWALRNKISQFLFQQDLFDNRLPLESDLYFFGRKDKVHGITEAIRRGENRGVFGLRKTGKTSLLFKIARHCEENLIAAVLYYDCKDPEIRGQHWGELLRDIAERIEKTFSLSVNPSGSPGKYFREVCAKIPETKRLCIVFDEIEYISFLAKLNPHWQQEYVDFWQTLWSVQSTNRRICFIVCGVNSGVTEVDLVNDVQNPMFQIFTPVYVTGLEIGELRSMVRAFGRRMGINFDETAISYLFEQYGGHPLLSRMACSFTHQRPELPRDKRPVKIDRGFLTQTSERRDAELVNYSAHVISEVKIFYPLEFDILEMIARGQVADVIELGATENDVRHIEKYGLISRQQNVKPQFLIKVVERYMAREAAKRNGDPVHRAIVPNSERETWLERRVKTIFRDIRKLAETTGKQGQWFPYSNGNIVEPEEFASVRVSRDAGTFRTFIIGAYRSLVEGIDPKTLKATYPNLGEALQRVRVYRHNEGHLHLNGDYERELADFLRVDTGGQELKRDGEFYFLLQQCVLDEIFAAIQVEMAKLD